MRQFCCADHQGKFKAFGTAGIYNDYCTSVLWRALSNQSAWDVSKSDGRSFALISGIFEYVRDLYPKPLKKTVYEKQTEAERGRVKRAAKYARLLQARGALRVWYRHHRSTSRACVELGIKVSEFHRITAGVLAFKRAIAKKRVNSSWKKRATAACERSRLYPYEAQLQASVVQALAQLGGGVKTEVHVGLRGRRCDVVLRLNGVTYAVECKAESKPTCVDEAVGQALVDAHMLNAVPVVCMPSDIYSMEDAHAISQLGILFVTELTIAEAITTYATKGLLKCG